jgi:Spy/CpxP family protein refolding chaperone
VIDVNGGHFRRVVSGKGGFLKMKKLSIIAAITIVLAAGAAFAQHRGPGAGRPGRGGPGGGPGMGPGVGAEILSPAALVEFLGLTEAQQEQITTLRESMHGTISPLAEEMKAKREELREAVTAGSAQQAGDILLAIEALRAQIDAARESFETQFEAVLTAEQKAKWDILQEIRELRGRGPEEGAGPGMHRRF